MSLAKRYDGNATTSVVDVELIDKEKVVAPKSRRTTLTLATSSGAERTVVVDDSDAATLQHIENKRRQSQYRPRLAGHTSSFTSKGSRHSMHDLAESSDFRYSEGLTTAEVARLRTKHGENALPSNEVAGWYIFVQQLWQPMPILIWIAIIIEAAIQSFPDMGILIGIQFTNAAIGYYEISKAGDAVAKLKEGLKAKATCKRDGKFQDINAIELVPGDLVILAAGSGVPADCRVNPCNKPRISLIDVDESAMNGESRAKGKQEHDLVLMGTMVVRGECHGTVQFIGANTELGTTAALLRDDGEASNLQKLLIKIVLVLTVISLTLCVIVLIYLATYNYQGTTIKFSTALSFTVVVLVASIPMAVEIVTTTTLALGSKELSDEGAIVTRLSAIEDMAGMSILCSDKTGTLTTNQMEIQEECTIYDKESGVDRFQLLRFCAMAMKWNDPPRDALDTMVMNAFDKPSMTSVKQTDFVPFDPTTKRTEGTVTDPAFNPELGTFKTSKGAPIAILALCPDTPSDIVQQFNHDNESWSRRGIRSMAIARTNPDGKWILQGMLSFKDPARKDSKETIYRAREFGIAIKMITGDNFLIAKEMAKELDMGPLVRNAHGLPELDRETKEKPKDLKAKYSDMILATDVFSQVFPEHKYLIVECLRELEYKVGMTGDGVNDAPALKRADVGVAVSGATEAAQSAAAIVLTKVGLSTIVTGIVVARCIFVRIRNFLTYRIAATLQLLVFFFIAVFWFKPVSFEPTFDIFFHMPVLMLMLITLLNDGTLIAIGYDNVVPQQMPEKWNIKALFAVSSMLALVALISSLLLLWMLLDSNTKGSWFQGLGIGGLSYGQVTNAIYLKISVSDFLTLFSARTGGDWFWSAAPAGVLLAAGAVALSISTALATWWPEGQVDEIAVLGLGLRAPKLLSLWIWLYCLFWWFIQDAFKVLLVRSMIAYNWFGYNDTGKLVVPQSALDWAEENKNDPEATSYHC